MEKIQNKLDKVLGDLKNKLPFEPKLDLIIQDWKKQRVYYWIIIEV